MNDLQPVTAVIAGLGRAGWDIHWRALLRESPYFRVVGAIEPLPERRAEAEAEMGCRTYANYEEFFADPVGELVIIATPSGGHGPEAVACLERGFHVVVDKPMCQGQAEAQAMLAAARAGGRLLTCYHPRRFDPDLIEMGEVVRSGTLGRLVAIQVQQGSFTRRNDWVMIRARGGGLHNVWGSHVLDQALQLVSSPYTEVLADLQSTVTPGDADDHCQFLVKFAEGLTVSVEVSNCMAITPSPAWLILGTQGALAQVEGGLRLRYFDPAEAPPRELETGAARDRQYPGGEDLPWREEFLPCPAPGWPRQFYPNVYEALRHGAPLLITPESVLPVVEILEIARRQNPDVTG